MMTETEIKLLLKKYEDGLASPEERGLLESWLTKYLHEHPNTEYPEDIFDRKASSLRSLMTLEQMPSSNVKPSVIRLRPRIAVVAAAVTAITLGVWLYYASVPSRSLSSRVSRDLYANDIAPGRNTATITFDDGEAVALNDEELSISSGSVEPLKEGSEVSSEKTQFLASRIARSKTIVLSTPRGGTYHVVLPDGSKVWLNADSKISFPSQFSGSQRKVLLTSGEAYFEVAKNRLKPFIVESAQQKVTVLGTHFNIAAYPDEGSTKTTLLEGSVEVNGKVLTPNQQSTLKSEALEIKTINASDVIAWKNGRFIFDNEPIESIMRQLARWYDVDVVFEDDVRHIPFTAYISRYDSIIKILDKITYTQNIHFRIEGRRITVMK